MGWRHDGSTANWEILWDARGTSREVWTLEGNDWHICVQGLAYESRKSLFVHLCVCTKKDITFAMRL